MTQQSGPVDYPSLGLTTVSNIFLAVADVHGLLQLIGTLSVVIGFAYNVIKSIDWVIRFFKHKK
jgi:hypothetical protein